MATVDRRLGVTGGAAYKLPCRVASTTNLVLSGLQTVDGVPLAAGDRVLVKDQTDTTENGVYDADTGSWQRSRDFDGALDVVEGTLVFVVDGTQGPSHWWLLTTDPVTFGTTTLNFLGTIPEGDSVSLYAFGAAGDGVADDTTAVQTALNSGYRRIFAPAGTYIVSHVEIPSNITLFGEGWSTIFKSKSGANTDTLKVLGTSTQVILSDFKVAGNSAGQGAATGGIIGIHVAAGASKVTLERIWVDDVVDWNFSIQGSIVTLRDCRGTNTTGATAPGVRGPYLIGSSSPSNAANNVTLDHCVANELAVAYTDGFILENGSDIKVVHCRFEGGAYTGFKIKTNNTIVMGCYASSALCQFGFQVQGPVQNLSMIGNIAYRCGGGGFQFGNTDTVTPARNWVVQGNQAIENGQAGALSFKHGFTFDNAANCVTTGLAFIGNTASDAQGVRTQGRGVSFGSNAGASYTHAQIHGNFVHGNTGGGPNADWVAESTSLDFVTARFSQNHGLSSGGYRIQAGRNSHNIHFWVDNVPASSGIVLMNSPSARGFVAPKDGYLRLISVRGTAALAAGQIVFRTLKNGVNFGSGLILTTGEQIETVDESPGNVTFAGGDIINVDYNANAAFLPTGTTDYDVTVELIY